MTEGPPPTVHGRDAYLVISAAQKAVRRGQPEEAAAFAIELVRSGLGAWWGRRAHVMACEDISPEATGLVGLALAPKSRLVDWLVLLHTAKGTEPVPIPDEALDMHTRAGRKLGRGRQHFADVAGRLIEWDGDLAALEADVRDRALARWLDVGTQPPDESANGTPEPPSEQLTMDGDDG